MNDSEMLQAILSQLQQMNGRLDSLESGQKDMRADIDMLKETQQALIEGQQALFEGQKALEEGQKALRRDVARVDRKIDRLANDVGDTLAIITEATDQEFAKFRQAK